jgi:hypothetical protein
MMDWAGPTPSGLTELQKVLMQGWVEGRSVQARPLLANKRAGATPVGQGWAGAALGVVAGGGRVAKRAGPNAEFAGAVQVGPVRGVAAGRVLLFCVTQGGKWV